LNKLQYSSCQEEINRCKKIYKDFKDAATFIDAVCAEAANFFEENPVTPLPVLDEDMATTRIRAGNSLEMHPRLKTADVVNLLKRFNDAVIKANPGLKKIMKQVNESLDSFLANSADEVTKEEIFALRNSLIEETELEQDLATFLFSFMLTSFYRQHFKSTYEVLRTDLWEGGDCPLCGEMPHYGQLRADDGAKQLDCWLCGATWVHTRIKCPFCGNTEREDLGYFTVEGDDKVRVNYCKKCCQYYKLIDARKFHADGELVLAIHNLASLTHDLLARQEGFTPGSGLEWVNRDETTDDQD